MFYSFLKIYARFAIKIYCKKIRINQPGVLKQTGPLLLACNHPNSFLDGMILTTLFDHPVYSLARGDAFKKSWLNKFLRSIRLLPVYRTSEGVENLEHNYTTFAACREVFRENGIVLIFSEGRCENEWHLRPLKKGTARLAITAWNDGIPLQVIPTAINYSSFEKFGKEVHIFFGEPLQSTPVMAEGTEGKQLLAFNSQLNLELSRGVYEIDPSDDKKRKRIFDIHLRPSFFLLALPAVVGGVLHAPLFYPALFFSRARFRESGHYDSVLTTLLLLAYPVYLLLMVLVALSIRPLYGPLILFLSPLTAWACIQAKFQAGL